MRFARATLVAAMAATSIIAAVSTSNIHHNNDEDLQQELLNLASVMKDISQEQSWSSDTLTLSDNSNSFSSVDEEEVTQWMERKEKEVQDYYTLLSDDYHDGERRIGRSSSMATQNGSGDDNDNGQQRHFLKMDGVSGRRQLRVVSTTSEEQQTPATEKVERGLGKGVGMKRNDPRAAGRFTPTEERTPPKGRDRDPPGGRVGDGLEGEIMESSGDESPPQRPPRPQKSGSRGSSSPPPPPRTQAIGSRWSHAQKSAKSMKPPAPPTQQFPNAVYVQQPPQPPQQQIIYVQQPPPQQHHQVEVEVEECYDIEELMAMGLLLNIQAAAGQIFEVEQQEEMTTRSVAPPIYRYDGTLLNNQKPGSRRTLQQYPQYQQYPYTYWTWDAKSAKSAKSAKVNAVYMAQPPPQQTVYVGQQQQQPPQPLAPPPPTTQIVYLNSKSGKSKSSKMGKMTKSGKTCIESPIILPTLLPSVCGMNIADASSNCGATCTSDADCIGIMDFCIPNVAACAVTTSGYCGANAIDASKCAVMCTSDAGCPIGESCFPGGAVECSDEKPGYCGVSVLDAGKCATECSGNGDCPGGENCFSKDVVECSDDKPGYCGSSVLDASKCAVECSIDRDCPGGENCFSKDAVECSTPSSAGYCGSSLLDASKCAVECTTNEDCPGGEDCFSQSVVACDKPGYCGADGDDASKCTDECTSDGDCPGGESCFTGAVQCKPGFCGADGDDATKCDVPCSSDVGCPSGESCFTGVKCEAETRCPTGCPDCDPDSPLPCPNTMMKQVCDKQNDALYPPSNPRAGERISNFKDCYDMCKPSFCCIHSSLSKEIAPTCAKEYENCPLYYPCYIIWWKLHDTIGPAPYLRVEQKEPFFNVRLDQLEEDFEKDPKFFNQLFGHHFDTDDPLMDDMFEDPENW